MNCNEAIATSFLAGISCTSGNHRYKNVYEFDKEKKSNTFRISYDFDGNYDKYGHSRDFRFNSVTEY